MDVERQQGTWTQLSFYEAEVSSARGEGGTGPAALEEWQTSTALNRERALASEHTRWLQLQGEPPDTLSTSGGVGGRGP